MLPKWSDPIWKKLVAAFIFFLLLRYLLSYIALSSFFMARIEARFDHPDVIDLYFASSDQTFRERRSARSSEFLPGIRENKQLDLNDGVARKIRIDLGQQSGVVELYGLSLKSHFGGKRVFDHRQIFDSFVPGNHIKTIVLKKDRLRITTNGPDPYIIFRGELKGENTLIGNLLPVIYSLVLFLLLAKFRFSTFPAITDLQGKTSSMGVHLGTLDGVRGLAALLVLAEHTGVLKGVGSLGVWLFFCLSGFLLSAPFVKEPARAVSPGYMATYLTRRLKRILPMYYMFITVAMMMHGKTDEVIRHLLFLQADGHLWTLPQEMCFYLILPLVVAALYLLFRGKGILPVVFLIILLVLANRYLSTSIVSLYGYGKKLEPMMGIFLAGMMFSYFYHWLGSNTLFQSLDRGNVRQFCSISGMVLLIVLIILSARLVPEMRSYNALRNFGTFGFAGGLFIFLVVLANNTLLSRIMSFYPLRAVGLVGFSFYLLHPTLINFFRIVVDDFLNIHLSGPSMFLLAGIGTYILAAFTYTYIERPFLQGTAEKAIVTKSTADRQTILRTESYPGIETAPLIPGRTTDRPVL